MSKSGAKYQKTFEQFRQRLGAVQKFAFIGNCIAFCVALSVMAPAYGNSESIQLQFFGRPSLGTGMCEWGGTTESRRKMERQRAYERTAEAWCKLNSSDRMDEKYQRLFKDNPVSYTVSFDDRSGIGEIRLRGRSSERAQLTAMDILKQALPFTTPVSDEPFKRGLLIRFSSLRMSVALGPRRNQLLIEHAARAF